MSDPINTSSNLIHKKKPVYMDKPRYSMIFAYENAMVKDYNSMLNSMVKNVGLTMKKIIETK